MLIKLKSTEKIVSVFIILGVILILSSIVLIGRGKKLFSTKNYYFSIFKSAAGLDKGMPINMNGLQIGVLESMKLDGNNNIALKVGVFKEHAQRIRKGSVLRLISPLVGSKTLEIIPGDINAPRIKNNSYLVSYDSEKGKKILSGRKGKISLSVSEKILSNVSELVERLNAPDGLLFSNLENIKTISQNIGQLSSNLVDNQGRIDNIFKHAETTTGNLDVIVRSLKQSKFFKEDKSKKSKKSSIDLNESYSPYKNK